MAKMTGFKVFKGTKQAFIESGKAAANADAIVFITGGNDGNKSSCIFAQGAYFGNITELMGAINYVKGINAYSKTDQKYQNYDVAKGGGYIKFTATDPSEVTVNVDKDGIAIGLTEAFVTKVNDTATNLGTENDDPNKDGSVFARIKNLAALVSDLTGGSTDSIEGQITAAINGLRTEILGTLDANDSKTLQAINDELDTIDANFDNYALRGETEINTAQLTNYAIATHHYAGVPAIPNATQTLNGAMSMDDKKKLDTLTANASTEGSVDHKINAAINDFANKVSDDKTINTLKELVDYVAGVDGSSTLATAIAQIEENKGKIETLNGDKDTANSVANKINSAILAEIERADGAYATAAQGALAATAYQKPSTGIPATDLATAIQTTLAQVDTNKDNIDQLLDSVIPDLEDNFGNYYTKTEVDAMWNWEEL